MNAGFQTADYLVFGVYALIIIAIGLYVSRFSKEKSSSDYFLAGRSLSWWAIGASLIAANISAEQFIGMSGSGFRIGIGIAAYEWIAAATLILVAKYLLPIMIEKRIYTMPQLLNERYGHGVSIAFSIFFLLLYLFVNLTSVAWLGALAMEQVLGIPMMWGVVGLLLFSGLYSIYGGLKAVVWTDIIQVVFLIGGGLVAVYFALKAADPSTTIMADGSAWTGLQNVFHTIRDAGGDYHLSMIIPEGTVVSDPATGQQFDISKDLPGLALLLGSIWVTNIGFWGFNQYIIQKGLAARSLHEAKKGLLFAGYLKLLIPLIVVIPGITAYVLFTNPHLIHGLQDSITTADLRPRIYNRTYRHIPSPFPGRTILTPSYIPTFQHRSLRDRKYNRCYPTESPPLRRARSVSVPCKGPHFPPPRRLRSCPSALYSGSSASPTGNIHSHNR